MSEAKDLTEGGKKPWFRRERRTKDFTARLSWFMAIVAAIGGAYVILDPVMTIEVSWGTLKIGGEGFSEQLKGAVVALILIEGWKAVKDYWLGASNQGQKAQETANTIAQSSAPVAAAAVAAAVKNEPTVDDPTPVTLVGQGAKEETPLHVKETTDTKEKKGKE